MAFAFINLTCSRYTQATGACSEYEFSYDGYTLRALGVQNEKEKKTVTVI